MQNKYVSQIEEIEQVMLDNQKKGIEKIYLFLDFDGVINVFYEEGTEAYKKKEKEAAENFDFADYDCIKRLDALIDAYPIKVIISSSWRFGQLKQCRQYLTKAGLKNTKAVVDTTQMDELQSRSADIEQYLLEHPDYSGFLIFDDLDLPDLQKYLVQTNPMIGYDEKAAARAKRILRKF